MGFPPPSSSWLPRFWVAGFDRWHFPVVILWALVLTLLAILPKPTVAPIRHPTAQAVRRLAPTVIQVPLPDSVYPGTQPDSIAGLAEPGVIVRLYLGQQFVGQALSGLDGHFQFHVNALPRGTNTIRIVAVAAGQASWSPPVNVIIAPPPVNPRTRTVPKLKSTH